MLTVQLLTPAASVSARFAEPYYSSFALERSDFVQTYSLSFGLKFRVQIRKPEVRIPCVALSGLYILTSQQTARYPATGQRSRRGTNARVRGSLKV